VVSAVLGAALAATAVGAVGAGAATAAPRWAPVATATVHPGVLVTMAQVQCRAGYVLTDGHNVYLGVPASCSGVGGGQAIDGCSAAQVPTGLPVSIAGARYRGQLVYSSFTAMASRGVTDANECASNSLSLVRLDPRDVARTNPSIPVVGGPTGSSSAAPSPGAALTLYVNAPGQALAVQNTGNGWSHTVLPGTTLTTVDVGAPVLDGKGHAVGMVTDVPQAAAGPAMVGDFVRELAFLHRFAAFRHVRLATATAAFVG
jgi:hypothetical protein